MNVVTALARHYDCLTACGEAPALGYLRERIGYALVLSRGGDVVTVRALGAANASIRNRWSRNNTAFRVKPSHDRRKFHVR